MILENVTYEVFGNPAFAYRIKANDGYVMQLPTHKPWESSKIVVLNADYDMSAVKVVTEGSLPEPPDDVNGDEATTEDLYNALSEMGVDVS